MSSLQTLALVGLASLAGVLISTAIVLFRMGIRALAHWLLGWSALLAGGCTTILLDLHPGIDALRPLFSTFIAPFMVLGACAHTERTEPRWLVPGALVVSAARASTFLLGQPEGSSTIAMATEPMLAFAAAWMMLNPRRDSSAGAPPSDLVLAIGFLCYGAVEFFDASNRLLGGYGWLNWVAWIGVAVPLAATQIAVHLDRFGRSARRFQDEARTNELRLRNLTESMPELVVEIDERGVLKFASAGAEAVAGAAATSLVGRDIAEFGHPDSSSAISRALAERGRITEADVAAESGVAQPARLPDGSVRWFEFSATSYRTPADELRILLRLRDVTAPSSREVPLRSKESHSEAVERLAGVAAWQFEIGSSLLDCSENLHRLHGLEPTTGPVEADRFRSRVHLDDRRNMLDSVKRLISQPGPIEYDYRIVRVDDGRVRTLRDLVDVDRDDSGRPIRVVGLTRDATDEVERTNLLRRDQERFRGLMESDIVGIFCAERSGEISDANDAFLAPLGYSKKDLPLDWRELTAPEFREVDRWRAEATDPFLLPQPFEKEFLARDGRRVPMLLSLAQVAPNTALMIATDLSERKQAEADRARHERELEETVAVRTRELLESRERLLESERLAVVGTLAAGVAHQINNPIGAILNCSEYALLCSGDEDARDTFERALRDNLAEARRCAQIVRSMLQFSRDQPTAKWVEDLNRVARRAQRAISAYAKDRRAIISFRTADEALLARISPIELEQAIVNVLRNAIESSPSGAKVSMLLSRRDKWATIEITDDGRGIPPENEERIFEPFFSTRTREGGTGLGLSVAHGVLADHGGQIRIDSIVGTGTRVVMTLPLDQTPPKHDFGAERGD